jgi:hypothetical protein
MWLLVLFGMLRLLYFTHCVIQLCTRQQLTFTSAGMPSPRATMTPPLPLLPADHCCSGHQQGAPAASGLHAPAPGGTHQPLLAGGATRKATRCCGGGRAAGHDAGAQCCNCMLILQLVFATISPGKQA